MSQLPTREFADDDVVTLGDFDDLLGVHPRTAYDWSWKKVLPEHDVELGDKRGWHARTIRGWYTRRRASQSAEWRRNVVNAALDNVAGDSQTVERIDELWADRERWIPGALEGTIELVVRFVLPDPSIERATPVPGS